MECTFISLTTIKISANERRDNNESVPKHSNSHHYDIVDEIDGDLFTRSSKSLETIV